MGLTVGKYAPIQVPIFWVMSRSPRLKEYTFASGRLKPRASRLHFSQTPCGNLKNHDLEKGVNQLDISSINHSYWSYKPT